jgi:chemotaxis protein MotB
MKHPVMLGALITAAAIGLAGCNQNPYIPPQQMSTWQQTQPVPAEQALTHDMTRRTNALDANNRDLHAQLAQSRQQVQVLQDQVNLLQQQLTETAKQVKQIQVAKEQAERKYQTLHASATRRGGALITANSSLGPSLRVIEIPGLEVRQEGESIHIELPSDKLFAPGTAQLIGSAFPLLDQLAAELARNYPRQRIGIEGHTDGAPLTGGISAHQLAAAQAVTVFEQLTRRNRLPSRHFSILAQGSNQPLASNGTQTGRAKNRRVELVVYPETVDGL